MEQQHKYREALQKRKISPSLDSWERLNKKLTVHDYKDWRKKWLFPKYAAVILVFLSIGFYFFQPKEEVLNAPIIVAPTLKEELKKLPEINYDAEIKVATTPIISPSNPIIKKKSNSTVKNSTSIEESIALKENNDEFEVSKEIMETEPTEILVVETISQEQLINNEVEELLEKSRIKIAIHSQNSTKKVVSANALLFEVEDDLDKDLKHKLFDKIVKTLKKPKQVITDRGN